MSLNFSFRVKVSGNPWIFFLFIFCIPYVDFYIKVLKNAKQGTTHDGKHSFVSTEYLRPFDGNPGHLSTAALGNTYTHTCTQWKEYNWPLESWPETQPLPAMETKSEWATSTCVECPISHLCWWPRSFCFLTESTIANQHWLCEKDHVSKASRGWGE